MVVRHGLWWFIMVCHGLSWFVMVRPWFTVMVHCHGSLSWFVMVCHGSLSSSFMVRHGSLSWFVMVRHGSLSWFVMVRHGSSWFTVHGFRHGFVMCLFSKILQKRSCDPLFSQSGSQIHSQISFLMRLLIFPFPFKEHTSKELC